MDQYGFEEKKRLNILKARTKRCVCKFCGNSLRIKRIIFNEFEDARTEIFCENCNRIEFGIETEIYRSAKYFVDTFDFNCFPYFDNSERTKQMTVAKVCEIMAWENKNLGFLSDEGFLVPVQNNHLLSGECFVLSDEDID